jgi:hypothetical protein
VTPLGGLMKVLLGGLLAWAFVSGALSRFIDQATAAVGGGGQPATTPAGSPGPGGTTA